MHLALDPEVVAFQESMRGQMELSYEQAEAMLINQRSKKVAGVSSIVESTASLVVLTLDSSVPVGISVDSGAGALPDSVETQMDPAREQLALLVMQTDMDRDEVSYTDPFISEEVDETIDEEEEDPLVDEGNEAFDEIDFETLGIDPFGPTTAKPGSEEKVLMLAARYASGAPLWHDEDAEDQGPGNSMARLVRRA